MVKVYFVYLWYTGNQVIYLLSIQNSNSRTTAGFINVGDKKRGEKVKKEKEEPIRNLLSFTITTAIVIIVCHRSALIIAITDSYCCYFYDITDDTPNPSQHCHPFTPTTITIITPPLPPIDRFPCNWPRPTITLLPLLLLSLQLVTNWKTP